MQCIYSTIELESRLSTLHALSVTSKSRTTKKRLHYRLCEVYYHHPVCGGMVLLVFQFSVCCLTVYVSLRHKSLSSHVEKDFPVFSVNSSITHHEKAAKFEHSRPLFLAWKFKCFTGRLSRSRLFSNIWANFLSILKIIWILHHIKNRNFYLFLKVDTTGLYVYSIDMYPSWLLGHYFRYGFTAFRLLFTKHGQFISQLVTRYLHQNRAFLTLCDR